MGRLLSKKRFEPFLNEFQERVNKELGAVKSKWMLGQLILTNRDRHIRFICFFEFGYEWTSFVYEIGYDGQILSCRVIATLEYSAPLDIDMNKHFPAFIENVVYETRRQKNAYITSKKIKRELVEKVWHPDRVTKWLEAGVALETL